MSSLPKPSPSGRLHLRRNSHEILEYAKHLQEKYILHPYWSNGSMGKITEVGQVADIDIAEAGSFKYVLIEVSNRSANYPGPKLVVRGDASCAYHGKKRFESSLSDWLDPLLPADIFEKMASHIDDEALSIECQGGGRICVDPGTRTITINGCSQVSSFHVLRSPPRSDSIFSLGLRSSWSRENCWNSQEEISAMDDQRYR